MAYREDRFNPVLGFLPVATRTSRSRPTCGVVFQSRAGFSPRRDILGRWGKSTFRRVSIPCWVFSPSRRDSRQVRVIYPRYVSIPCWVFSPSRRRVMVDFPDPEDRFQSRAGFSPRRDSRWSRAPARRCPGFNPVLGFLPVATAAGRSWSRRGRPVSIPCWVFSPSRRQDMAARPGQTTRVSIPCWVFSPSRRRRTTTMCLTAWMFQSRAGFSPRRDGM